MFIVLKKAATTRYINAVNINSVVHTRNVAKIKMMGGEVITLNEQPLIDEFFSQFLGLKEGQEIRLDILNNPDSIVEGLSALMEGKGEDDEDN